jgi:hypothetical protein
MWHSEAAGQHAPLAANCPVLYDVCAAAGMSAWYRPAALLARSTLSLTMNDGGKSQLTCPAWLPEELTDGGSPGCACVYLESFLMLAFYWVVPLYLGFATEQRNRWVVSCCDVLK